MSSDIAVSDTPVHRILPSDLICSASYEDSDTDNK